MDLFFLKALLRGRLQTTANFEEEINQIPVRAKRYRQIEQSDELKEFNALEKKVNAPDFQIKKKEIKNKKFKYTEEYKLVKDYEKLCKKKEVRNFLREGKDAENAVVVSYQQLKAQIEDANFQQRLAFWKNTRRWETTDDCKMENRYNELKKNNDIVFYQTADVKQIEQFERFTMTFEDDFKWIGLNESAWKPGFIYPNENFKNVHSYSNEKQAYNNGKNTKTNVSVLTIRTKKERVEAPAWDEKKGMYLKQFDYTSDALYTDKVAIEEGSVVQVKCRCRGRLNHGIYLRSKNHVPFISLFDYTGSRLYCGVKDSIKHDKNLKMLKGLSPIPYTIFTVSWQNDEIVWFVNNLEVYRTKNLIDKDEKLYLHLYSFIFEKDRFATEGELDVDWVRVYKLNK